MGHRSLCLIRVGNAFLMTPGIDKNPYKYRTVSRCREGKSEMKLIYFAVASLWARTIVSCEDTPIASDTDDTLKTPAVDPAVVSNSQVPGDAVVVDPVLVPKVDVRPQDNKASEPADVLKSGIEEGEFRYPPEGGRGGHGGGQNQGNGGGGWGNGGQNHGNGGGGWGNGGQNQGNGGGGWGNEGQNQGNGGGGWGNGGQNQGNGGGGWGNGGQNPGNGGGGWGNGGQNQGNGGGGSHHGHGGSQCIDELLCSKHTYDRCQHHEWLWAKCPNLCDTCQCRDTDAKCRIYFNNNRCTDTEVRFVCRRTCELCLSEWGVKG